MNMGRNLPPTQQSEFWKQWDDVKVLADNIPRELRQTSLIYDIFQKFGEIVRVEVTPKRNGQGYHAFVLFHPPPQEAFWARAVRYRHGRNQYRIDVKLLENHHQFMVQSPIDPDRKYPERMYLQPVAIDFGFMLEEDKMMRMKTVQSISANDLEIKVDLLRKRIDASFRLASRKEQEGNVAIDQYRLQIQFSAMDVVHEVPIDAETKALVIPLASPPEAYRKTDNIWSTHIAEESTWNEWCSWIRQTDVLTHQQRQQSVQEPIRFRNENAVVDLGRWLTYRLVFKPTQPNHRQYDLILQALQDHNISVIKSGGDGLQLCERTETRAWEYLDVSAGLADLSLEQYMASNIAHLSFPVRYQLEVCLSRGLLNEYNMTEEFFHALSAKGETAVNILEAVAEQKRRYYHPINIFKIHMPRGALHQRNVPSYCCVSRAAVVTPTTIHYSSPMVEISNRVVRQFAAYEDRFLRVRFSDELSIGKLHPSDVSYDEVFARITRVMRHGITLGERHYEFLAFGNSQFRENGAYFFASGPNTPTVARIRAQLGDFSDIKVPAKWCARLGQNLSTTRAVKTQVQIRDDLDDIKRNGYVFTDGVGKISNFLAQMIASEFGLPNAHEDPPSMFQFRLSGCKGVLAVAPEAVAREIHIRESQYKFPAKLLGLEIIRSSQFVSAVLNRQLIVLLSTLNVPDKPFLGMLQGMLADLETAIIDEKMAVHLLQKNIDFNQTTLTMASMVFDGFLESKEPFMMSMMKLWRSWMIKFLKEKAKIFVPNGACLLGCVDEYGVLRGHVYEDQIPGLSQAEKINRLPEIFFQVDPSRRGRYQVIEGICILARNPSLHPGDIRIVKAVDKPELRHLKNVVVLPQTGDRDLASMCSGGDLDGDDYLVIWDKTLLPDHNHWNQTPMDFTPPPPVPLDRPVTVNDITDFFVQYIKNDKIATIAHAHLAWADFEDDGVNNGKCKSPSLTLASIYSH
jgi:RNA-dependent RNA polymerase